MTLNWKTTLFGIAAIVNVAVSVVNTGHLSAADLTAVLAGFGLIAAKDGSARL